MRIFSIDIETTGLDSRIHSMVEIAIVSVDLYNEQAPEYLFHRYIIPENLTWTIYCLNMHRYLLEKLITNTIPIDKGMLEVGSKMPYDVPCQIPLITVFSEIKQWLFDTVKYIKDGKVANMIPAGKNFANFDLRFIERLPTYHNIFKHRTLDPVSLYTMSGDEVPPELKVCKERAIALGCDFTTSKVSHTAVDDARDVVKLLRFAVKNKFWG
jgi:oligoribonuclease (3'-5' exoribonuclease)